MAHMLESMVYVGDKPWHGLGREIKRGTSPQDALVICGADWEVEKQPLYLQNSAGEFVLAKGKQALVRKTDSKIFDYVGDGWHPTQNRTAAEFFDAFCSAGDMTIETMGTLRGGRWFWALANLNEGFALRDNDVVKGYLLFSNPHIWGMGLQVQFTPIRVVCNNTLTQAVGVFGADAVAQGSVYRQGHAKVFDAEKALDTLNIAKKKLDVFQEQATLLSEKTISADELNEYFAKLFPSNSDKPSRRFEQAMDAMEKQPGAEMSHGTFWQAFNAVTFIADHQLGRSADTRLASAWYGDNKVLKQKALDVALKMAA